MTWIPCADYHPAINTPVLWTNGVTIGLGRILEPSSTSTPDVISVWAAAPWHGPAVVTHWQPLPELPAKE